MKLTRVHIIKAATCGGLLDELDVGLRGTQSRQERFNPLCLVGPNGAGKSQFLQIVAEAFQTVFHACVGEEERAKGNEDIQFEIEYVIRLQASDEPVHVRLSRRGEGKRRPMLKIERKNGVEWTLVIEMLFQHFLVAARDENELLEPGFAMLPQPRAGSPGGQPAAAFPWA